MNMDMAVLHPMVSRLNPRSLVNMMLSNKTNYELIHPVVKELISEYLSAHYPIMMRIFDLFNVNIHDVMHESHVRVLALSDLLVEIDAIHSLKKGARYKQRTRALFEQLTPNIYKNNESPRVHALTIRILFCIVLYLKNIESSQSGTRSLVPWAMLVLIQYISDIMYAIVDDITPEFRAGLLVVCNNRVIQQLKPWLDELGKMQITAYVDHILVAIE